MNWLLFAIALFVSIVLEMSIVDVLDIGGIRPSFVAVLAIFVALWAPKTAALWGCLICGLAIDLTSPIIFEGGQSTYLFGPHGLGYVFGCLLALQVRSMVMRRQVLAIAVIAGLFVIASSIVLVAIYTARSWYSPELASYSASRELLRRFAMAVYTAAIAIPGAWLLLKTFRYWKFPAAQPASANWR